MKTIQVSEATPLQIDWLVAKALGYTDYPDDSMEHGTIWHTEPDKTPFGRFIKKKHFHPSTSWGQAGPIIKQEKIDIKWVGDDVCQATIDSFFVKCSAIGPTPLIAAMRCYIASKMGDRVEVPEEL